MPTDRCREWYGPCLTRGVNRSLIASVLALVLAAACGVQTFGTGSSPTPTGGPASASPGPAAAPPSVTDVCTLVAKADAEAVIGPVSEEPAATSAPLIGVAERGSVCLFRSRDGVFVAAVLERAITRSEFDALVRQLPGVQPVDGIGDNAYATVASVGGAGASSVLVLKGSTYFTVTATMTTKSGDALLEGLKALAQKAATIL